METNKIKLRRYKTLPWHLLVLGLSIFLLNLGGAWGIIALIIGAPSLYAIISRAMKITNRSNSGNYSQTRDEEKEALPNILYFKNAEAALSYARDYLHNSTTCVGIVRSVDHRNNDVIKCLNFFTVSAAATNDSHHEYIAQQHASLDKNIRVGDFVYLSPIKDSKILDKYYGIDEKIFIITAKLQPAYSILEGGWLTEV